MFYPLLFLVPDKILPATARGNRVNRQANPASTAGVVFLHSAYTSAEKAKAQRVGWAKCLVELVAGEGFEPSTFGL